MEEFNGYATMREWAIEDPQEYLDWREEQKLQTKKDKEITIINN